RLLIQFPATSYGLVGHGSSGHSPLKVILHTRPPRSLVTYRLPSAPSTRATGRYSASLARATGRVPANPSANTSYSAEGSPFPIGRNTTLKPSCSPSLFQDPWNEMKTPLRYLPGNRSPW